MASNPADPLHTLQAALKVPPNSKEQADLLAALRVQLENAPAPIPILAGTLTGLIVNAGDSLLKRWVIDLLHFAICRSSLSIEQRTQMASQTLDTLAQLLEDPNLAIVKVSIQTLTTVYPLLFRLLCTNRSNGAAWNTLSASKTRIIEFLWSPSTAVGVKLSAMKFVQRVILVQTRGVSDPRLQNKNDPNLALCPADHPFIFVAQLENEGKKLFDGLVATLYTSQSVDLLSALLNSWSTLTKLRPAMVPLVIGHLKQWTPSALTGLPASSVKSAEKALRILLIHISRVPANAQYVPLINEALTRQAVRMDAAAIEEKKRKTAAIESRKRPLSVPTEPVDAKRPKLESETTTTPVPSAPVTATSANLSFLASFDFTSLPATLITELIVANLEAFTESTLLGLVQAFRESRGLGTAAAIAAPAPTIPTGPRRATQLQAEKDAERSLTPQARQTKPIPTGPAVPTPPPPIVVKDEPVDPLQMDIDQDELEYEPDRLNEALSGDIPIEPSVADIDAAATNLQLIDFRLPPPRELTDEGRTLQLESSIKRIWEGAKELNAEALPVESTQAGGHSAPEIWMLLLVRMITRVAEPPDVDAMEGAPPQHDFYVRQDQLRQKLCNYIMADFPARVRLATTWMNEEWYNDQIRLAEDPNWLPNYDTWLNQIVASYQALLDGKDRTFARFLLDLPTVPSDVLGLLRDLCHDSTSPDKMHIGFATLRGLVINRPSMRADALRVLLELTTHPEKKTRGAAINTVKLWVPNIQPMDSMVREFALQMLRKLELQPVRADAKIEEEVSMTVDGEVVETKTTRLVVSQNGHNDLGKDENMEDGQLPPEDLVETPYLPRHISLPADKSQVLQHVELLFALSVKVPEFLEEIFEAYGQMDVTVQGAIQELITALIRSLGSSHGKLLTLMRTFPPGAESLALRVLTIFTEHGRPSAQLVALVKGLINERDLDARFLIPIIAEMDKPDIMRHLPRIVSILNGQPEPKNLVRSVFSSVVTTPPQTFGSVTSNLPRVRQSELLTPAELMVLLHESEKEIGLKSAIEAIGICFSMTDVFRSEILAVVMQQIMDEPVLPVLFLRTVIQAVTTYKSLVGFVSTTLLSRLITKKIWTNPPLWEGFIRCAKVIAPASFGALLQLPKDQLRELVDKQPSLKSGLRDFVTKKAPNKARVAGFLDIFGEPGDSNPAIPIHSSAPDDFTPPPVEPTPEPSSA
ncbi:putative symplekin tight junction protein C terminal [Lyophyllum shimeji]|uniref:Symplekin tight junction protein C terminal n=1 Tax=Lyophyllum shimeji TaxID=47721 RepID=A0A9P3PS81_LYOSH|nr:putative symplekin tight junction protein C terminal [Lyophyllum shimeji]